MLKSLYVSLETRGLAAFSTQMGAAAKQVQGVGRATKQAGADLERLAGSSSQARSSLARTAAVVGVGLVAGLIAGSVAAVRLEQDLANVSTISKAVRENTDAYADSIVALSTKLPQSAHELALGLYDIVSSGFDAKDALTVLEVSASSASAGLSDTATAGRAITAVLNAYGLSAAHAGDVSDVLFQTVNKGVVTFSELANVTGHYVGTAAAAGVSIGEANAALAAMTLNGNDASEAAVALNQVMNKILVPSEAMSTALHAAGYESGYAALQTLGLKGTIDLLSKSQGAAADTAFALFPEIRAAKGYLALTAAEGRNYASTFDAIADKVTRAQAAQAALRVQEQSAGYQMKIVRNQVSALGIEVGRALLPAIHALTTGLHDFLAMVDALPGPVKDLVGIMAGIGGVGLLAGAALLKMAPTIRRVRTEMELMRVAGSPLPGLLGGVGKAAGLLGVALIGATFIYGAYAKSKQEAKSATEEFARALAEESTGSKGLADDIIVKTLVSKDLVGLLGKAGIAVEDYVAAIREGGSALDDVQSKILHSKLSGGSDLFGFNIGRNEAGDLRVATAKLGEAFAAGKGQAKDLANATDDLSKAQIAGLGPATTLTSLLERDKDGALKLTEAQKALGKAFEDMVRPAEAAKEVLSSGWTASGALSDALQAATKDGKTSLGSFVKDLRDSVRAQEQWETDLATITRRAGVETASALRQLGTDGMSLTHQLATGSDANLTKVKDSLASLAPSARKSLTAFRQVLEEQLRDKQALASNLAALAINGRVALARELAALGPEAAPLVAQAVRAVATGATTELDRLEQLFGTKAALTGDAWDKGLDVLASISAQKGKATVESLAQAFTHGNLDAMTALLRELRDAITDLPTRKKIDIILGVNAPKQVVVPIGYRTATGTSGQADGSVLKFYGDGAHVAQIAPAGAWRVWAEPETGGEAYIPLAPGKRRRSTNILAQTAKEFGYGLTPMQFGGILRMAGGGVVGAATGITDRAVRGGGSVTGIEAAIAQLTALTTAWESALTAMEAQARRHDLVAELAKARVALGKAKSGDRASATDAVVSAQRALAEFDRQASLDAQRRALAAQQARLETARAAAEARARLVENKQAWAWEHMTATEQLALIDARIAKERKYSDEWLADAQERDRLLDDIAAKRAQIDDNRHQWEFDHASTTIQLADLQLRMSSVQKYSDEWMRMAQQAESILDGMRAKEDAALGQLNGLLDQRDGLLKRKADAVANYGKAVGAAAAALASSTASAVQSRVDALIQVTSGIDVFTGLTMRNTDLDLANRTLAKVGLLTDAMRAYAQGGTDVMSATATINSQVQALSEWADALARLRKRGLSEDVISALGLDSGPDKLAQVQEFTTATAEQITALNTAVSERARVAGAVVAKEQQGMFGGVGRALLEAQGTYSSAVAGAYQMMIDETQAADAELVNLGRDGARSLADAIAEGLASGIPGIVAVVTQIQEMLAAIAAAAGVTPQGLTRVAGPSATTGGTPIGGTPVGTRPSGMVTGRGVVGGARTGAGNVIQLNVDARGAVEGTDQRIATALYGFVGDLTRAVAAGVGSN